MTFGAATVTLPATVGCSADTPAIVDGLSGYLSNYHPPRPATELQLSPLTSTMPCPWRIVVGRGQRIDLTLIDFMTPRAVYPGLACEQYAVVTEWSRPPKTRRVCAGAQRRRHLYESQSNFVDVRLTSRRSNSDQQFYFLLHYKGRSHSLGKIMRRT